MERVFSPRLFLCLEHFFLLPYYIEVIEVSSATVGGVFHTITLRIVPFQVDHTLIFPVQNVPTYDQVFGTVDP